MDETHNAESYWICGVVIHIDNIRTAQRALTEVAEKAAEDWNLAETPELHGYEIWQRQGDFAQIPPRACVGIYSKALDVLAAASPVIVLRGVDRTRLRYQNPHRLAWRYAIESVDRLGGEGPTLVVADEHAETERALRGDIRSYISFGTGGWDPRTIENVLPELKFFDSKDNALLQGADLVAYLHQRRRNVPVESDERAQRARERLWATIASRIAIERMWTPPA
jgi:Protein of unknown function (DUF3800)